MSDRSVTFSCARTARPPHGSSIPTSANSAKTRAAERIRLTILHAILLLATAGPLAAQDAADPFARGAWHVETAAVAAIEAWNYNLSHEELYGLDQGVAYGLRDGLALRMQQRFIYVSQRSQDAVILGLTIGVRSRVMARGRWTVFVQGDVGISHTAVAAPPRGTRFNYLAIGGGGVMVRMRPRLHLVSALQLIHVSNNGVKGPSRNPDIEAIGPSVGLLVRF
jgi:hypothetical protein